MKRFLLFGLVLLSSCASMKEVERESKKSLPYLLKYYGDAPESPPSVISEGAPSDAYQPPQFVEATEGSHTDSLGNLKKRRKILIKVREGGFRTDF